MNSQSLILLGLNILFLVAGQGLWKAALARVPGVSLETAGTLALMPQIWGGLVLYGLATLLWFKVLADVPLSIAYPMQSLAYVLGIVMAVTVFGESVPWTRWLGSAVILAGVYLVTLE